MVKRAQKISWVIAGTSWTVGTLVLAFTQGELQILAASFWIIIAIFFFSLGIALQAPMVVIEAPQPDQMVRVLFTEDEYALLTSRFADHQVSDPPIPMDHAIETLMKHSAANEDVTKATYGDKL